MMQEVQWFSAQLQRVRAATHAALQEGTESTDFSGALSKLRASGVCPEGKELTPRLEGELLLRAVDVCKQVIELCAEHPAAAASDNAPSDSDDGPARLKAFRAGAQTSLMTFL